MKLGHFFARFLERSLHIYEDGSVKLDNADASFVASIHEFFMIPGLCEAIEIRFDKFFFTVVTFGHSNCSHSLRAITRYELDEKKKILKLSLKQIRKGFYR